MRATPRTDPYVRDYLIRLLPWVSDEKALIGIRVKDSGFREPSLAEDLRSSPVPTAAALAATT